MTSFQEYGITTLVAMAFAVGFVQGWMWNIALTKAFRDWQFIKKLWRNRKWKNS